MDFTKLTLALRKSEGKLAGPFWFSGSIFYTHLLYGCLDSISILQKKRCSWIINFAPFSHTNNMFFDSKLLKFDDIIRVEQLKYEFDFKSKNLLIELLDLFKLNSDIKSHITLNVSKGGIFTPQVNTTRFGIKSQVLRYSASVLWNNFY